MAQKPEKPQAVDPNSIQESLCDGQFYLTWQGDLGTLTFTHLRPKAGPLFASGNVQSELIVRARVVMTGANFAALRDLLVDKIKSDGGVSTGGAGTRH